MRRETARRIAVDGGAALVLVLALGGTAVLSASLRAAERASGWALFALVVGLAAYHLRKRLPFLPLGSSATWMALHSRAGVLAIVVFFVHAGGRLPAGALERVLALLFWAVSGSGIVGLLLTRAIPRRLAARGEEVLFERIPLLRRRLREQAEAVVLGVAEASHLGTLAGFYGRELAPFFAAPRNFWPHLSGSGRPLGHLLGGLAAIERYLDERERGGAARLASLIRAKDDLDFHHTHQAALKGWLFVHVGLTWSLLLVGLLHGALGELFSGVDP